MKPREARYNSPLLFYKLELQWEILKNEAVKWHGIENEGPKWNISHNFNFLWNCGRQGRVAVTNFLLLGSLTYTFAINDQTKIIWCCGGVGTLMVVFHFRPSMRWDLINQIATRSRLDGSCFKFGEWWLDWMHVIL